MVIKNIEVWGFEHAIRGMRNPMNSWDKSDSTPTSKYLPSIGDRDLELMRRLYKAGTEHRKYLRQIFISMDITAPLYWWKEFDTYKVGTVANSCSTMHKLATEPISTTCFEIGDFSPELIYNEDGDEVRDVVSQFILFLEQLRLSYLETKDKRLWKELVRWLPEGWLQKRTITMNYENAISIIKQRTGHKLVEWELLVNTLLDELPYLREIMELE